MGGAAILLYLSEFSPKISAICIDSCFSDLTTLLHDFSCKYLTSVIILEKWDRFVLVIWWSFWKNLAETFAR